MSGPSAQPRPRAANETVVRLLADSPALPVRATEIVSGYGAGDKTVRIAGIDPARAAGPLASAGRKDRSL